MQLSMEIPRILMHELSPLCDLDFALAHLVLEDEKYRDFYRQQSALGRYVILDNSFHELGRPLSVPELWKAYSLINASIVIAPDKLKDTRFGLESLEQMVKTKPWDAQIGAVLCGESEQDRLTMFNVMRKHRVDMICFPFKEDRLKWFGELLKHGPWPSRIHLLGMNTLQELRTFRDEFEQLAVAHQRVSMDTGKPIKLGLMNKRFHDELQLRGLGLLPEPDKITPTQKQDILYNIAYLRSCL